CVVIRRPQRATLSPYTTLFRSEREGEREKEREREREMEREAEGERERGILLPSSLLGHYQLCDSCSKSFSLLTLAVKRLKKKKKAAQVNECSLTREA